MKYGFESDCNFSADYFETRYFKFQLSEIYYYHALSELLYKYFDWIPEVNPLLPIEESQQHYFDDDALPF